MHYRAHLFGPRIAIETVPSFLVSKPAIGLELAPCSTENCQH